MNENPFTIAGREKAPVPGAGLTGELTARIEGLIGSSRIFLFMKGDPSMPQCGFSANVVAILGSLGAEFDSFDILSDMDIRQGLKEYSGWPTYPQLYVDGKLVGGGDIVVQLYEQGELAGALGLG